VEGPADRGAHAPADAAAPELRPLRPLEADPWSIRDRRAARESLERILGWDFDRVVVAHGDVLERGGREALRQGYAWLLAA
jgi:hypothetical protein